MTRKEDAVSEVIGYIIILGIVFLSFGLIFFNATAIFTDTEETERLENAQRGFTVLQSNVDEVVFGESPRQKTQVRLGSGSVSVANQRTRMILNVSGNEVRNRTLSSIEYTLDDQGVTYENGAVFRQSVGGVAMASEPAWVIRDDMVSIPSIRTFGGGSVGGDGTASVRTATAGDAFVERVQDTTVNVTIVSENAVAWNRYMEDLNETFTVENVIYDEDENSVKMVIDIDFDQTFVYVERPIRVEVR
jgi:hypothetical protein